MTIASVGVGYGVALGANLFLKWNDWIVMIVVGPIFSLIILTIIVMQKEEEQNKQALVEAARLYIERNK